VHDFYRPAALSRDPSNALKHWWNIGNSKHFPQPTSVYPFLIQHSSYLSSLCIIPAVHRQNPARVQCLGKGALKTRPFSSWHTKCCWMVSLASYCDVVVLVSVIYWGWLGSRVVSMLDSGAEGRGFKSQPRRCRVTVLGKLFTPIVPLFTKRQNW